MPDNMPTISSSRTQQGSFSVPLITDALSSQVRDCVRKAEQDDHIRVIEIPPANLKAQLVRNRLYDSACTTPSCMVCTYRREGDCSHVTVYLIACSQCNEEYIGETGRPLWVRVEGNVDGQDKCKVSTPLGEHRLRSHSGAVVGIAVTILARELDIAARKTLEALWIAFKNPVINRREERVAVTQEMAPFADSAGLTLEGASRFNDWVNELPGSATEGLTRRESSFRSPSEGDHPAFRLFP
ncbi:unnamed protein product [Heligmosomoides polygyrus]|uniref:DUF927 domain-containing protein n=1 Tax=Heligmosomoides polygyrus TaxID=6339 RepID=A0A183F777_HELPZ|nr:unnamed protein product [Heligmosomoides polygyrus]